MSQSDYLKHKKISNKLNIDHSTNDPAVLDSQDYIHYRSYALKNEILNTKTIENRITPSGKQMVFGVELSTSNCPTFIDCSNTHLRPNRELNSAGNLDGCVNRTFYPLSWQNKKNMVTKEDICLARNSRIVARRVDCNYNTDII